LKLGYNPFKAGIPAGYVSLLVPDRPQCEVARALPPKPELGWMAGMQGSLRPGARGPVFGLVWGCWWGASHKLAAEPAGRGGWAHDGRLAAVGAPRVSNLPPRPLPNDRASDHLPAPQPYAGGAVEVFESLHQPPRIRPGSTNRETPGARPSSATRPDVTQVSLSGNQPRHKRSNSRNRNLPLVVRLHW